MDAVLQLCERFLEHPKRRFIVIFVTCVLSLLVVWPSADTYFRITGRMTELRNVLAEAEAADQVAIERASFAGAVKSRLDKLEAATYTEDQVHMLRGQLTDLVRQTGCQLRRIEVAPAARRKWLSKDDALDQKLAPKDAEQTPFKLRSQVVSLSVTGSMSNLKELLGQINGLDKLMHTQRLQLRSATTPGQEDRKSEAVPKLMMELELLLLGLETEIKAAA
jgi:hypothetical protein